MKKIILLVIVLSQTMSPASAQLMKKLNQKINQVTDKALGIDQQDDKKQTSLEKKEYDAQSEYSDATENNEKPIFVDAAPPNGKMVLKLKNGDRFWGGYITIKGQPRKDDVNANVLDFINARVGSFYTAGEISNYAIYFDGQRHLNDSSIIPLRPEFISYDTTNRSFFSSTEGTSTGLIPDMDAMSQLKANMTEEEDKAFKKKMTPTITQPTFSFKFNGKTYGPFDGIAQKMLVLKSMTDGKPTGKFYGFGSETFFEEEEFGYKALVQTEKAVIRVKHFVATSLTYPTGFMAMVQGTAVNTFSNGKTVPVIEVAGIEKRMLDAIQKGGKFFSEIYGTDSCHVVCIVTEIDKTNHSPQPPVEAIIDYKTVLKYPMEVAKQNLLIASNPAKSVLYKMHTLYYPDGTKDTIDNVGDAQLVSFNGKEYIVWFEMTKVANGHEIYVCQKELK